MFTSTLSVNMPDDGIKPKRQLVAHNKFNTSRTCIG